MAAVTLTTPAPYAQALADLDQAANLQRLLAQMSGRALSLLIDLAIDAKDERDGDCDFEPEEIEQDADFELELAW